MKLTQKYMVTIAHIPESSDMPWLVRGPFGEDTPFPRRVRSVDEIVNAFFSLMCEDAMTFDGLAVARGPGGGANSDPRGLDILSHELVKVLDADTGWGDVWILTYTYQYEEGT